jgi:hypothetical protein
MNNTWPWIILAVATTANFLLAVRYIKEPDKAES